MSEDTLDHLQTAVVVRDEVGKIAHDFPVDIFPGETRVDSLAVLHASGYPRVREVIVYNRHGYGGRMGRMVRGWRPWPELGYVGVSRGPLELGQRGLRWREQIWVEAIHLPTEEETTDGA
jgi:hypothetical protein